MATTKQRIGNLFFNYQGEYSSTKTYYKDDVVMYNNTDWICTKNSATTGTAPEDNQRRYARLTKADLRYLRKKYKKIIAVEDNIKRADWHAWRESIGTYKEC